MYLGFCLRKPLVFKSFTSKFLLRRNKWRRLRGLVWNVACKIGDKMHTILSRVTLWIDDFMGPQEI